MEKFNDEFKANAVRLMREEKRKIREVAKNFKCNSQDLT